MSFPPNPIVDIMDRFSNQEDENADSEQNTGSGTVVGEDGTIVTLDP